MSYAPLALSAFVVLVNAAYSAHLFRQWRRERRAVRAWSAQAVRRQAAPAPVAVRRVPAMKMRPMRVRRIMARQR